MNAESIPVDPRNPMPLGSMNKQDELRYAQSQFTDLDIIRKRQSVDRDTTDRVERDNDYAPDADVWIVVKGSDPRQHRYFEDLMRIIAMPGVKGSLVKRHIRPVYGSGGSISHGEERNDEAVMAVSLRTVDRLRTCTRSEMRVTTNHGRTFVFDPERPTTPGDVRTMGHSPYLYSEGSTRMVHGYTGRHVWDYDRKQWRAEREARGAYELTPGQLSIKEQAPPEPYCEIHYESPLSAPTVGAR